MLRIPPRIGGNPQFFQVISRPNSRWVEARAQKVGKDLCVPPGTFFGTTNVSHGKIHEVSNRGQPIKHTKHLPCPVDRKPDQCKIAAQTPRIKISLDKDTSGNGVPYDLDMSKLPRPALPQRILGNMLAEAMVVHGWFLRKLRYQAIGSHKILASNPSVSVLIPTHNRSDLLIGRSLASVLAQTYQNLEIIVCAHGCTDDTVEKVSGVQDSRVRLVAVPRKTLGYPESAANHWLVGPVRPLNAGLRAARGQLIAILGDDDEWVPNHIEDSVAELRRSGAEWVSGWSQDIDSEGHSTTNRGSLEVNELVGPVATWVYMSYLKFAKWNIHSWRKGWNRPNDIDLARRFLKMGVKHTQLPQVGAIWRPRPGEASVGVAAYINHQADVLKQFSVKPDPNS